MIFEILWYNITKFSYFVARQRGFAQNRAKLN